MKGKRRSKWSQAAALLGAIGVAGFIMFGSAGDYSGPLGTGQQKVTAQADVSIQGTSIMAQLGPGGGATSAAAVSEQSPQFLAAYEALQQRRAAAWAARAAGLPAVDPRVPQGAAAPRLAEAAVRDMANANAAPSPQLEGAAFLWRGTEIVPPAGFGSVVNEPAVSQAGRFVHETWNWFAARSANGGIAWALLNPATYGPGMPDFCCDQDTIYAKGRDRFFWERMGISDVDPSGNNQNRILINVSPDAFATNSCFVDLRGTMFGEANAFLDYPRLSLSSNYLYMVVNVFDFNAGGFRTHLLLRIDLDEFGDCRSAPITFWKFTAGWTPATIENATSTMYLGDHIITSTGLNNTFRIWWVHDDNTTLNAVDKTIAAWLFTQGNAVCPVDGGANPCARADHRIVGAVKTYNTPVPGTLGHAGDKLDFYWNVRAGNGFPLPYTESAGFQGNTLNYVQRKLLAYTNLTVFYTAAGANDRGDTALSALGFRPPGGGNPTTIFGIDDGFNTNPPAWEIYNVWSSTGIWTSSASGDYLRSRVHAPDGTNWILSAYRSIGSANNYRPNYSVVGRQRDGNGFARFDQS